MGDNLVPNGLSIGFKVVYSKIDAVLRGSHGDLPRCSVTHPWPDHFARLALPASTPGAVRRGLRAAGVTKEGAAPEAPQRHRSNGVLLAAEPRRAVGRREAGSAQLLSRPLDLRALVECLAAGRTSPGIALRRWLPERIDWSTQKVSAQSVLLTPPMRPYKFDL